MLVRPPGLEEIRQARARLIPFLAPTPWRRADALSEQIGRNLWLKMECWQPTGSFKVRGALNLLAQLTGEERERGLVAASAGNHGAAVGYVARALGIRNVSIFVPEGTPQAKIGKMQRYGVDVRQVGGTYDDAHHAAVTHQELSGATFVHAYDDVRTAAGAGTMALEILEQAQDLAALLVPVGGGGMISGIAAAVKALAPKVRIVGVQPDASPALRDSLRDRMCYEEYISGPTICDGLAGGIGRIVFEVAQRGWIDDVVIVSEQSVRRAVATLLGEEQILAEGSGAVGLAALKENPELGRAGSVGIVLSGANLDMPRLVEILNEWT